MYITIEGVIGVGKTTATRLLAEALGGEAVFEAFEENPFLKDFYKDRDTWALQTQCFFLLYRLKQLEDIQRRLQAGATVIADFDMCKNCVFADLTLSGAKREKFRRTYDVLTGDLPRPDLIVYLTARHETVMERIRRRGREYERDMDEFYIRSLGEEYERYLGAAGRHLYVPGVPVLHVDTTRLDLVSSHGDRQWFTLRLLDALEEARMGLPARGGPTHVPAD